MAKAVLVAVFALAMACAWGAVLVTRVARLHLVQDRLGWIAVGVAMGAGVIAAAAYWIIERLGL